MAGLNFGQVVGRGEEQSSFPGPRSDQDVWDRHVPAGAAGTITVYTVPAGKILYISTWIYTVSVAGTNKGVLSRSGTVVMEFRLSELADDLGSVIMPLTVPIKFSAGQTVQCWRHTNLINSFLGWLESA